MHKSNDVQEMKEEEKQEEMDVVKVSDAKREATAIACAGIQRLGVDSPVSLLVSDTFLFRSFCFDHLPRHELVDQLAQVTDQSDVAKIIECLATISEKSADEKGASKFVGSIVQAGCIESIISTMTKFSKDPRVQRWAAGALGNIAAENVQIKRKMAENRAIETTATALKHFLQFPKVCEMTLYALGSMVAHSPWNKRLAANLGVIEAAIEVICVHAQEVEAVQEACLCLWNITSNSVDNKRRVAEKKGIEAILALMEIHLEVVSVQETCFLALGNVCANSLENQRKAVSLGAVERILVSIKKHPSSLEVAENVCGCIWHLLSTDEIHVLKAPTVLEVMRSVVEHFPESKKARLCLDSVTRTVVPALAQARENQCCEFLSSSPCHTSPDRLQNKRHPGFRPEVHEGLSSGEAMHVQRLLHRPTDHPLRFV